MLALRSFARDVSSLNIKPLGGRVLVELDKSRKEKVGNLYVPETAQQQTNQGIVKAVGPGVLIDGKRIPMTLSVGQRVLLPQFGGQTVKFQKQEFSIIGEEEILAIVE